MNMQLAKSRRLKALGNRNSDRILVCPAAHPAYVNLPKEGSAADYLLSALNDGTDVERLAKETGWTKSTVIVNLYRVAKKTGVGIRRRQDDLHLMLPAGAEKIYPRTKTVNPSQGESCDAENARVISL